MFLLLTTFSSIHMLEISDLSIKPQKRRQKHCKINQNYETEVLSLKYKYSLSTTKFVLNK